MYSTPEGGIEYYTTNNFEIAIDVKIIMCNWSGLNNKYD